jgi:hypothetical protein
VHRRSRSPELVQRKGRGFTSSSGLRAWDLRKFPKAKIEGKGTLSATNNWIEESLEELSKQGLVVSSTATTQPKVSSETWEHDKFTLSRSNSSEVSATQHVHRPSPTYD